MSDNTAYVITNIKSKLNGVISQIDENNLSILWEDEKEEKFTSAELDEMVATGDFEVQEVELDEDEGSEAAKTIATHKTADANNGDADGNPKTRIDWIKSIVGSLGQLDVTSLAGLQDEILAQIGGEGDRAGLGDKSKGNQASIAMKPSAAMESVQLQKEEMDTLFGESDLTEEFKSKLGTLFESAVTLRLTEEMVKLEEQFESKLQESIETITEDLVETIDSYFGHVVEEWLTDNEVAIESTLRNELTTEFIDGLKNLFQEHYIEIPDERLDVYESLVADYNKSTEELNKAVNESLAKDKQINSFKKDKIVAEATVTLTLPERQKLKTVLENVDFENEESFRAKVKTIKEGLGKSVVKDSNIVTENLVTDTNIVSESFDPSMKSAMEAITKNKKFSSGTF